MSMPRTCTSQCLLLLAAVSLGCAEGPSEPPGQGSAAVENTSAGSASITDVIGLWNSGNTDQAVRQFVTIEWNGPGAFTNVPVLNTSENDFQALSAGDRARMGEESIALVSMFKGLARDALQAGDEAREAGDQETAAAHYQAVREFGEALSTPDQTQVIQMMGQVILKMAEEKDSGIEHQMTQ